MNNKYLLTGIVVTVMLVATGVIYHFRQNNVYRNEQKANTDQINSSSSPLIYYSSSPKVIGKELNGLLSIPEQYKPQDVIIDIDALAEPYLEQDKNRPATSGRLQLLKDPEGLFSVMGYGIYQNYNSLFFEYALNWEIAVEKANNATVPAYKFKSQNIEGYINRSLTEMVIKKEDLVYTISYSSKAFNPNFEGEIDLEDFPGKSRPASELFIFGSTFRFLK